jgi:hypothetical protein
MDPAMADGISLGPVPNCWSVRPRGRPGLARPVLVGAEAWGRDAPFPRPMAAPFTTIAWRLGRLSEMLTLRADYTVGGRA